MKNLSILFPLLPLLPAQGGPSLSNVVVPIGHATTEANSGHDFPWACATNYSPFGSRVQTIYDPVYFTGQGWNASHAIHRLRWRADGQSNPVTTGGSYGNVRIDLSTAAVAHRSASFTYDNNHGADRVTVYQGPVTLSPSGNQAPNVWYIDLVLTTPFAFDPSLGGLVVDIAVDNSWTGGTPARADAVSAIYSGVVEATTIFHRMSSQAGTCEWRTRDFGFVLDVGFAASGQSAVVGYGSGCAAGAGVPLGLQALSSPVIGTNFDVAVQGLPQTTAVALFVLSAQHVDPGVDLASIGAPGCRAYVDLTAGIGNVAQPIGPAALHSYTLPNDPSLVGASVYVQAAGIVPGANAAGLLTSDALDVLLGSF